MSGKLVAKLLAGLSSLCLLLTVGCIPPMRIAADGHTMVPLGGLGEHLPADGFVPKPGQGPIYFDSLYSKNQNDRELGTVVRYFRFWPSGQVLLRSKVIGQVVDGMTLAASDGDVVDDWLRGPSHPKVIYPGVVGRYCIVGQTVYMEMFGIVARGGRTSLVYEGRITKEGFILQKYRDVRPLWGGLFWVDLPEPDVLKRQQVGEMHGEPTW